MKKSRIIYFLFGIIIINFAIFCFAGCKKDITICSFEFLNSETGEYVKPSLVNHYGEMFLTYNGEQKNIEFRTVRDDNGKEIKFIQNIDISYTYKNPKTGELEYGKPYMQEVGEYFLHINTCSYNESKYYISYVDVSLTIYIQEADTPKKIELNRKYQVNINNGEAEKFSFIAPYSMMYSVAVENANVKVFDFDSGADILNESGDKWFINKNQQVIIELSSDIENISESILITPSPEFLIIGKEYEYRLEYGEECIYKFWDNKNHDLSIKTNDKNIGVVVYNKNGNILYILNNDSYAYIADQEVYVRIYNNSEQVIEGNLVICDNIPILANQKISINVKGNETVLKTFECFESGVYNIISNVLENIKIDICDKNGNCVEKQYLNKYDINFLRIQNYSSYDVDLEVMVEFYPDEVTYGSNFVNSDSEFVRFTSASDEIYLLSGVDKVYDYNFNIVKLDNGRIFYDSINKYYYFKMKTNKLSISFPFETLKIGKKEIIVDNIYGLYYYSIGIDFNAEYQFLTSVQSLSILNSEYNFIDEVRVNKPISLLKGTYYLKINNKEKNGEVECILNGEPLNLGTNYVLKNDGYKIFAFIPSKAQSYHFVIQNDKNNTARCMIKVCKLVDGDFVVVYETQKETNLNESIYLGNDLYYIFVYLFDANDQQLVFFSS